MSPVSRRNLIGLGALAATAAVGLSGCQPTSTAVDDVEVDDLLTDWTRAVQDRDRDGHDRVWAASAPEFVTRLASLLDLGLVEFAATRTAGPERTLEGPRLIDVAWRLPGDTVQRHRLPVVASRLAGDPALAPGTLAPPASGTADPLPMPLWWLQDTVAVTGDHVGLLVGGAESEDGSWGGKPLDTWRGWAERSAVAVSERTGRQTSADRRVWFEMPGSTEVAQRLLGGDTFGAVAALAVVVGEVPAEGGTDGSADEETAGKVGEEAPGPVHVVLDPPQLGALSGGPAVALLTHEAVHVVTAAPRTELPLWVEEGWAEAVGWAEDDAIAWSQAGELLRRIRSGKATIAIPDDAAFDSDGDEDELAITYALSWSVCRWMVQEGQRRGAPDDGWALPRRWYDLQAPADGSPGVSEEEACAAVLDMSADDRERRWQDWLAVEAARR